MSADRAISLTPLRCWPIGRFNYIERTIPRPAIDQMAAEGAPFVGALFAGLMLTSEGPKVLSSTVAGRSRNPGVLPLVDLDLLIT